MLQKTPEQILCGITGKAATACSCRRPDASGRIGTGVKFQRIRRITGYLVGTLDKFNNAKRAEEADRVKHGGCEGWNYGQNL